MTLFRQSHFTAPDVRSLCWRGDDLVDWVGGGRAFTIAGEEQRSNVSYGYRFDAATASPDGRFAVIYERLGTKGLLLRDGRVVRELDRSYDHADAYEFPVVLFNGPDGRPLLAHCPGDYCRLEFEEAETGRSLTASADRKPTDFFHSQLRASPRGKRLLSAGWLWHPLSLVTCYDVAQALADPRHLDDSHGLGASFNPGLAEESSACWLDDDHLAVAASAEPEQDSIEEDIEPRLHPCGLAVYNVVSRTCLQAFKMGEPPGTMFPVGKGHVLSLYRHPKLIELSTGKVLHAWTELSSGRQDGSIMWGLSDDAMPPPMAFDPTSGRFAIANRDTITVLEFNLPAFSAM
ncbi:hypothetical protein G8O24_23325 [Bradyrhizobium sp. INPA01-394B]|uniref:Uncharacterized protein n=1 Tax=Bradyrhizobium campsiandrae TaxID=1729892 RepID=A0ABR7U352_9BRAD|nr:hypothetical protein [Bradyrhizobium campsiandrae]MBC9880262.1 hypothetical protein [Bradyrhizobium campsiandrae]MBC9978427.1 hypothetical protein [Bradyrhizobium campsiandrae]